MCDHFQNLDLYRVEVPAKKVESPDLYGPITAVCVKNKNLIGVHKIMDVIFEKLNYRNFN